MNNLKWGSTAAIFAFLISIFLGIVFNVAPVFIILRGFVFAAVFFGIGFGTRFLINNYFPEILVNEEGSHDDYGQGQHEGEHVDTGVGSLLYNTGEYALPELFRTTSDTEEIGNIEDLISGAFNQNTAASQGKSVDAYSEAGYNSREGGGEFSLGLPEEVLYSDGDAYQENSDENGDGGGPAEIRPAFTPSFGGEGDDGMGGLPDLDMMARAFSSGGSVPPASGSAPAPAASAFVPMSMPEQVLTSAEPEPSGRQYNKGNKPEALKGDFKPKEIAEGIRSVLSKDK